MLVGKTVEHLAVTLVEKSAERLVGWKAVTLVEKSAEQLVGKKAELSAAWMVGSLADKLEENFEDALSLAKIKTQEL